MVSEKHCQLGFVLVNLNTKSLAQSVPAISCLNHCNCFRRYSASLGIKERRRKKENKIEICLVARTLVSKDTFRTIVILQKSTVNLHTLRRSLTE